MSRNFLFSYGMNTFDFVIGAGYLTLFFLSLHSLARATRIVKPQHLRGHRLIWTSIAVIILMILISSVFDISKTLMDNIRIMADNQGWYNNRYSFQVIFIAGVFAIILLAAVVNETSSSGILTYNGHVIRWLIALFAFNLINSISFHFIDQFMNIRFLGLRTERWLETSIMIFIFISYTRHLYDTSKKGHQVSYVTPARYI
jgi:hypothetical protein